MLKKSINNILINSQKFTGLDNIYFFNSSFFLGLKFFFQSFSGLIISIAFSRTSTTYIFGQYNLFISILSILSLFSLPGLSLATVQSVSKGYFSSLRYAFYYSFKYSFLSLPFFLLTFFYFYSKGDLSFAYTFLIASVFFPLLYSSNLFDYYLIGKNSYKRSAFLTLIIYTTITLGVFFSLLAWPSNLNAIVLVYLLVSTLPASFITFKIIKEIKKSRKDQDLLKYGRFITFTVNLLSIISSYADNIIVGYFLGTKILAYYAIGQIIPQNIKSFMKILFNSLIPKITQLSEKQFKFAFKQHFLKLLFIGILVASILWFSAPYIIPFIFSKKYASSIQIARILSLQIIVYPLTNIIQQKLLAHKNRIDLTLYTITSNITKIVIYIFFIYLYGLIGLIWGLVIYSFIDFIYLLLNLFFGNIFILFKNRVKI